MFLILRVSKSTSVAEHTVATKDMPRASCVYNIWATDQAWGQGDWISSFFFASIWIERKLRTINTQKRWQKANIQCLGRTGLVNKRFIIWHTGHHFLTGCSENTEADQISWSCPLRGSQSQYWLWFILLARGPRASHIIKWLTVRKRLVPLPLSRLYEDF